MMPFRGLKPACDAERCQHKLKSVKWPWPQLLHKQTTIETQRLKIHSSTPLDLVAFHSLHKLLGVGVQTNFYQHHVDDSTDIWYSTCSLFLKASLQPSQAVLGFCLWKKVQMIPNSSSVLSWCLQSRDNSAPGYGAPKSVSKDQGGILGRRLSGPSKAALNSWWPGPGADLILCPKGCLVHHLCWPTMQSHTLVSLNKLVCQSVAMLFKHS